MVLMKAGVWHTTVFADRTWPEDLWLEYGTAAAGGDSSLLTYYNKNRKRKDEELFFMVKQLLEAFV